MHVDESIVSEYIESEQYRKDSRRVLCREGVY